MNSEFNFADEDIFGLLSECGTITLLVTGSSMRPLIRDRKDSVQIEKYVSHTAKVGDIVLYRCPDGKPILHRIIKKNADRYIICGDSQTRLEYVSDSQICGKAVSLIRNGKTVSFSSAPMKCFFLLWKRTRKIRPLIIKIYHCISHRGN